MARVFTHQDVHDLLQNEWESDLPDKVIEALRPHNGKLVGKNLIKYLPEVPDGWRIRRDYGMTHLESWEYTRSQGSSPKKHSLSLLLAHSESNVYIDVDDIEKRNPAYFSARRERNHARMEAMNTKETLDGVAQAMSDAAYALEYFQRTIEALNKWTEYGAPVSADKYDIERAVGLRDSKGERVSIR